MVVANSEEMEYQTPPKQVSTHVALCGLKETQQQPRFFIGIGPGPQRNTDTRALQLSIMRMLTQIIDRWA